jgi:hypothetical protein
VVARLRSSDSRASVGCGSLGAGSCKLLRTSRRWPRPARPSRWVLIASAALTAVFAPLTAWLYSRPR